MHTHLVIVENTDSAFLRGLRVRQVELKKSGRDTDLIVIPFLANVPILCPQKTKGFLLFSGGTKWEHRPEIGYHFSSLFLFM